MFSGTGEKNNHHYKVISDHEKNIQLLLLMLLVTVISSCLKDTNILDPAINATKNVIELANYGIIKSGVTSTYPLYFAYVDLAAETDFNLTVNYAGAETAPEDITVTLASKPEVLTKYNTENSAKYVLMPDSMFSIPAASVTILKGQRQASFKIKLKTTKFDLAKTFALPVSIISASSGTISGNFGNAVYYIAPRNKWDGTYTHKGESVHEVTPTLSGTVASKDYALITDSINKVYMSTVHAVPSGTALAATYLTVYTINSDNSVMVTSRNPAVIKFENSPGYNSRYDPEKKIIYAKWRYPLTSTAYRTFTDTLTYKAARS